MPILMDSGKVEETLLHTQRIVSTGACQESVAKSVITNYRFLQMAIFINWDWSQY